MLCQSGWSVSFRYAGPTSTVITSNICEYLIWLKTKQCEDKGQRRNNREQNHMPKHETGMLDMAHLLDLITDRVLSFMQRPP